MRPLYPPDDIPRGVEIPKCQVNRPAPGTPPDIEAFFGKTGTWWGTWRSPQIKGNYDAVLVIREIYGRENHWEASVTYASAPYPKWYVEGGTWERAGVFEKKADGKTVLAVRHPAVGMMEFWLESGRMQGKLSMRFMLCRITLKPFG